MQLINNTPNTVSTFTNVIYLLVNRPLFIIGFTMFIMPILVGSTVFRPIKNFLSHSFWVPLSRLSYGAFLCHGIFMQFREYNVERGEWGSGLDAFLFFLAFWTFSFLFSFGMALVFEFPISSLWYEFAIKKEEKRDAFYHS